jgi:hypothetical protein
MNYTDRRESKGRKIPSGWKFLFGGVGNALGSTWIFCALITSESKSVPVEDSRRRQFSSNSAYPSPSSWGILPTFKTFSQPECLLLLNSCRITILLKWATKLAKSESATFRIFYHNRLHSRSETWSLEGCIFFQLREPQIKRGPQITFSILGEVSHFRSKLSSLVFRNTLRSSSY